MQRQDSFIPSYMKIQNYVSDKIKCGEYPVGSKIPSEIELAELFSVSRITANKAIKEMSLMGTLERIRGRGTFVTAIPNVSTASKAFVSAVKLDITSNRQHQLIQFRVMPALPELAEKAQVAEDTLFYEIILANKDGDHSESLDFTYIPCSLVSDITPSLDYLRTHYVYDYLRTLPDVNPKFLKIFVNTPQYSFLDTAVAMLDNPESMSIWCTDVYDGAMKLLATTFTTYPSASQDVPLLTFAL